MTRWSWCWALALAFFAPMAALSQPPIPRPLDCVNSDFQQKLKEFTDLNPNEECKLNAPAKCDECPQELMVPGKGRSCCKNLHWQIRASARIYQDDYKRRCEASNAKLRECTQINNDPRAQVVCLKQHSILVDKDENDIARHLMKTQDILIKLEQLADQARGRYRAELRKYASAGEGPLPDGEVLGARVVNQTCTGRFGPDRRSESVFGKNPSRPDSEGRIIDEMTSAMTKSLQFREIAYKHADLHQKRGAEFAGLSRKMADIEKRLQTAGTPDPKKPPDSKSDITGTEQKPPQAAGGQPPGGGGGSPAGGGAQSGQPSGFDQGGGSNTTTPPSFNAGDTTRGEGTKNQPTRIGSTKADDAPTSKTSEGLVSPVATSGLAVSSGLGADLGTSRGLASTGSGRNSSASSSPGGGGGGLGGGGGDSSPSCAGKDCQAMSATGGQFAPVGSLGGAGGGMGGLGMDDSSALDNLFKTDDAKSGEGPGADALADLGNSEEGLEGLDGEEQAGGTGGEIGKADGGDLFLRVRTMYTRAQKKGLVAGMLKKL